LNCSSAAIRRLTNASSGKDTRRAGLGERDRRRREHLKSHVSRILRPALLAPDIVEAILAGKTSQALMLAQLEQRLPGIWEEQRRRLAVDGSYDRG
jgi:hypothetical protein